MLFNPDNHTRSERHKKIYAYCELAYTVVDFSAAALFVIGSILFFNDATVFVGTWLFLIGSVFFGLRPTIKLFREIAYIRADDYVDVAANLK
ncbi:MAG: YrhK family protein [Ruegeria sp.]